MLPVLNLSDSTDWSPERATDVLASVLQSRPEYAVIPVRRVRAAMELLGATPNAAGSDLRALGETLEADVVITMALTEYSAYAPLRVGLVLQAYDVRRADSGGWDASAASRWATEIRLASQARRDPDAPDLQVQTVYSAARPDVQKDVQKYAREHGDHGSAFGWRKHTQSQDLFLEYSIWAAIRSMDIQRTHYRSVEATGVSAAEAGSGSGDGR